MADIHELLASIRTPRLDPQLERNLAQVGEEMGESRRSTIHLAELAKANMASQFYERLGFWIKDFDDSLQPDEEVGVRLVSFGQAVTFHVEEIGYNDPSLIIFHGTNTDGQKVTLIQHVSQISFLLVALKRETPSEPKKKFGFCPPEQQCPPSRVADTPE